MDDFRPLPGALSPRLTTAEAAVVARRHPVTVRRALEGGELHGQQSKAGGRWLIRAECLDAWMDGVKCVHQSNVSSFRRRSGASQARVSGRK
ncbi:helix-turn-helix domain-containing protein [Arthrobacter sp. SDTb3-6]|uniref:helix-turn-helix domain-containing protein n=1 Tax=Arthrobacter sp. SDTb3-6 TaxID=2713571 RepID=UPI003525F6AA